MINYRTFTAAALAALTAAALATPAFASSERMHLECTDGTLTGHVIERSNGSSWWDQSDSTVYTTHYINVERDGETVYEHTYGSKSGPIQTCTADHFGYVWYVEVVAAGRR